VAAATAVTAVVVAIFLVGEETAGDVEDDEDDAGEAEVEARMRPANGVFLARQGDGRFSGSAAVSVSSGDVAVAVAVARGEAGAVAEAAADTDDAADNDGEPAAAAAATAAVSTISPSAMLEESKYSILCRYVIPLKLLGD
jgi:hypothetical protein